MFTGAITQYIDVAQLVLYLFWAFFFGLVLYLHRESKREGYPLDSDRSPHIKHQGFPAMPSPKRYLLPRGGELLVPGDREEGEVGISATPLGGFLGAPLVPDGDPLVDGVGPAAWAERRDVPDTDNGGSEDELINRIRPLSQLGEHFSVADFSIDPRGLDVRALDGVVVGKVTELWIDHMESIARYYSVQLNSGKTVLLPMMFATYKTKKAAPDGGSLADRLIDRREREINVDSITSAQFENVPVIKSDSEITMQEEDRVQAYYGGGHLYALKKRTESFI